MGAKERSYRHTKARREGGFCAYGGCDAETGDDYRCPEHKKAHAAAEKARYRLKREAAQP